MIKEVLNYNSEILKEEIPIFDFNNPSIDPIQLSHDLAETMISSNGMGLAANQIGLRVRAFAIKSNPIIVCFNPKIVAYGDDQVFLEEGCLSSPGLIIKIKRPDVIRLRYTEPNGNILTKKFQGLTARIIQHEVDHLDGIDFRKRALKFHYEQAMNKLKKRLRSEIRRNI